MPINIQLNNIDAGIAHGYDNSGNKLCTVRFVDPATQISFELTFVGNNIEQFAKSLLNRPTDIEIAQIMPKL